MNSLDKYMSNFAWEINHVMKAERRNVYLGGMFALELHGFKTPPREQTDLDIIIYEPTDLQIFYLESIIPTETHKEGMPSDSNIRSYKFKKSEMFLDFIIEEDAYPVSSDYLECGSIKIQRVDLIINAKLKYGREKDIDDVSWIISNNFLTAPEGITNHSIKKLIK